ncbi:MAG TPA: hypothetical protein VG452_03770 [Egibacteraceae bacterium]|nr:hypothetical protein [Egibacteraceae bacterium]
MATIQIRDVPEDVYQVFHRRARAAGKSIQAYMLDQVRLLAAQPTDEELFAAAEDLATAAGRAVDVGVLLADRDADRR